MLEFCSEVSEGNLSVRIQDKHKDELSRLSGSMDHMADTIEHLQLQLSFFLFFSIQEDGEEQLVTYIFNKNLNQLFVYTMPYHYINSEVYAMLKQILVVVVFLVLLCIVI